MSAAMSDSDVTRQLLTQVGQGDQHALAQLLERYRPALRDFVDFHLDSGIRGRVDASDVVQETQMELVRRMDDYLRQRPMPFHLWARKKAYERLLNLRRDHRGRAKRSVEREDRLPDRSSLLLAKPLLDSALSPSQNLQARELHQHVSAAVAELSEFDREILLLRHAEGMSFEGIGYLLEIAPPAARKRFGRALIRLQGALADRGILE